MRVKMHKIFFAWQFEQEEAWLNSMSAKGLALIAANGCTYHFEECTPGEYTLRLQLLEQLPSHPESAQYIKFIEETGAECIAACGRWVYFRKRCPQESFTLYSDMDSKLKHLNRILIMVIALLPLGLFYGTFNFYLYFFHRHHPVSLGAAVTCLCIALFLCIGIVSLGRKRRKLKKEKALHE